MTNVSATIFKRLVFVFAVLFLSGCYGSIRGTVVDADTNEPIEGAIVLASWTRTFGLGHTHQDHYKAVEAVTDKDGRFHLPGCYCFYVDKPRMVVYKFGYVAWRNDSKFGGTWGNSSFYFEDKERYGWRWTYKLEKFKEGYSRSDHATFMGGGLSGPWSETPMFNEATRLENRLGNEEDKRLKR